MQGQASAVRARTAFARRAALLHILALEHTHKKKFVKMEVGARGEYLIFDI